MAQSKLLTEFYNAYNNWLEDGAPVEKDFDFRFHRGVGMCCSVSSWVGTSKLDDFYVEQVRIRDIQEEMLGQFREAGLDLSDQFGTEGEHAWVKAHLES